MAKEKYVVVVKDTEDTKDVVVVEDERNEKRNATYTLCRADDIDWNERTMEISFSSEEPVKRGYGYEVLDHSSSAKIDFTRLEKGAGPLLLDHNSTRQIGIVERAWIDSQSKRGKAVVRFSRSELASEILQDVKDGIRKNISFGYSTFGSEPKEERSIDGLPSYRFDTWKVFEISVESVPADITVGIARNLETKIETKNSEVKITMSKEDIKKTPEVNVENVRKDELNRINMIRSLGDMAGFVKEAKGWIEKGDSAESFRNFLTEKSKEAEASVETNKTEIGMDVKERKSYSLFRALNAQLSGDWSQAGLEREMSQEVENSTGRKATGVFIPGDVLQTRATATAAGDGAGFIGTNVPGNYVDALKSASVIMPIATVYDGLQGSLQIPVLLTQAATQYDAEDSAIAEDTTQDFGSLTLTPKQSSIWRPVSRMALAQAIPSLETAMMDDFVSSIALSIDSQALVGPGTNAPTGIINDANVTQSGVLAGTIATYAELVGMYGEVIQDHMNAGINFVFNPAHYASLLGTTRGGTGSDIMAVTNNTVAGAPVVATNGLTAGYSIAGDFRKLAIGLFGALDVFADPYTEAVNGNVIIRAFQFYDAGVTQPDAFAWRQDSSI